MVKINDSDIEKIVSFLTVGAVAKAGLSEDQARKAVIEQLEAGKSVKEVVDDIFKHAGKEPPKELPDIFSD